MDQMPAFERARELFMQRDSGSKVGVRSSAGGSEPSSLSVEQVGEMVGDRLASTWAAQVSSPASMNELRET